MKRTFVCKADEIVEGEGQRVDLDPPVAVYRVGGQFYVTTDSCTHEEWSLGEEGELEGYEVTCSLHLARFDIRTGRALCLPAMRALRTYPVVVEDGDVLIAQADASEDGAPSRWQTSLSEMRLAQGAGEASAAAARPASRDQARDGAK